MGGGESPAPAPNAAPQRRATYSATLEVLPQGDVSTDNYRLTPRELDVMKGLVRGHPNKTIAYDLDISPRTVEIHRANLMQKLNVHSLSDALRIAFAAGMGETPE